MLNCIYCNKEITEVQNMIKNMHAGCAMEVTHAYCFAFDYELKPKEKDT